jgi:hypothetical protein
MPRLNFDPKRDGFHFANRFTNHVGPFTTRGRCGGMVYAALDYYLTGTPIPSHVGSDFGTPDQVPPDGNRLADYLYSRLMNSILNWSAGRFLMWQAFWNSDSTCVGWSLHDEFNHLKDRIDHNQLTPLGLVAKSGGPGASHQVLAYGYDYDANGHPMVYIWDNNRPDVECVLKASQQLDAICEYNTATDPGMAAPFEQWKGYFVHDDYNLSAPQHPPYQDIAMSQAVVLTGAHVRPDPAFNAANPVSPTLLSDNGQPLAVHFAVKNYGDFPAHLHSLDTAVRGPHGENLDSALGGMDNNRADLAPGEERVVDGHNDAFGIGAGLYSVNAAFLSANDFWFTVPTVPQAPMANTVHFELDAVRIQKPIHIPPIWPFQPHAASVKGAVTASAPAEPMVTDLTDAKQPVPAL